MNRYQRHKREISGNRNHYPYQPSRNPTLNAAPPFGIFVQRRPLVYDALFYSLQDLPHVEAADQHLQFELGYDRVAGFDHASHGELVFVGEAMDCRFGLGPRQLATMAKLHDFCGPVRTYHNDRSGPRSRSHRPLASRLAGRSLTISASRGSM